MPQRLSGFWKELVACHGDLPRLLELTVRRAAQVVGEASVLTTVSDAGDELVPVAVHHADPEVSRFIRTVLGAAPYPVGEGLAGTVASCRQRVVLSNIGSAELDAMFATHADGFLERYAIHAVLIVPMIAFGEVVGTLGVVRLESNDPYGNDDIVVLEALAERAALALADATRGPVHVGPHEYEAIFHQSVDGILVTVPDGHVVAANPAACAILQRSEDDICRLGRAGLLVADDPRTHAAMSQRALTGKVRAEVPMVRGDGETFIADMSSTLFTGRDGVLRSSVIFRDVTSRVQAQEELATQHQYLELLHAVTTAVNEATDVEAAIGDALHAVATSIGWPLADALLVTGSGALEATSVWHVADPVHFGWFPQRMRGVVVRPGEGPAGTVMASKAPLWVSDLTHDERFTPTSPTHEHAFRAYIGVPIMAGTDVRGVLELFSDQPTPRDDRLLALLADLGTQVGRAIERSESEAVRRRVEADRAAFVDRAAHELRSPVSSLVIAADLLAEHPQVDAHGETLVGLVSSSVNHLALLVERLLDLSQIERGNPMLDIQPVDIAQVVDDALAADPPPHDHTVTRDVAPGSRALVDKLSLEQALANLLRNAYRYGGQHVVVTARRHNDHLLLSVADDGCGVDPAIETTLFEPFVRGRRPRGAGSGLGLAISRRLVEAMGGTLCYEGRDGGGSRFVIAVPQA